MTEDLVIKPVENRWNLDTAIRVRQGRLIVIDELSRRFSFDLSDPDGPKAVYYYYVLGSRVGGTIDHCAVVDSRGRAFLDASKNHWDLEDFRRLARAAGLRILPPTGVLQTNKSPDERSDYVEIGATGVTCFTAFLYWLIVPLLLIVAFVGLTNGFPWMWPILLVGLGIWSVGGSLRKALTIQRNRPHLPADEGGQGLPREQPSPPPDLQEAMRERNVWRRAALWGALALVPPVIQALR
jgi:hypothetical protein